MSQPLFHTQQRIEHVWAIIEEYSQINLFWPMVDIFFPDNAMWKRFPLSSNFAKVKESNRKCGYGPIFDWTSTKFEETLNAGTVGKISYPFIIFTCIYTCVWLYSCFACMYVYISIYICIWLHVLYVYHKICTFSVHAFRSDLNKHLFCIHPTSFMDTVHAPSVSLYTLQELSERYAFATSSQGSI